MYTEEEKEDELLILRPVGPGIQDLESGNVVFAASRLSAKHDGTFHSTGSRLTCQLHELYSGHKQAVYCLLFFLCFFVCVCFFVFFFVFFLFLFFNYY